MNVILEKEYKHLLEQIRDPNRRSWIFLNAASIGDTATNCAIAQAFVKQHGHAITLVVPPDHLPIAQMYPNRFLRIHTAERGLVNMIANKYLDPLRFEIDVPIYPHPYVAGDCRLHDLQYLSKYPGRGGMTQTDMIRHLLRLPWDAQYERPTVPAQWDAEAEEIAKQIGMPKGESVILFPANNSPHPQFPDVFWETVAARLTQRGLKVFCNMRGGTYRPNTMPIAGTTPIDVQMHQGLSLVNYAGRIVSSATGMQLLVLMGGRFKQMTVTMPISKSVEFRMNQRQYHSTFFMAQYIYPEFLPGLPFAEFSVPYDGTEQELKDVAIAVADDAFNHPNCVKRMGSNGRTYLEEQDSWLRQLMAPMPEIS